MILLLVTNTIYTILQACSWCDKYTNFVKDYTYLDKNWKPARRKFIISSLTLCLLILSFVFVESNHLIP